MVEYAFDESIRVLGVRFATRRFYRQQFTAFTVFLGELLDATTVGVEPIRDVLRVEVIIDDKSTNSVNIIPVQFHLVTTKGEGIAPMKSILERTFDST